LKEEIRKLSRVQQQPQQPQQQQSQPTANIESRAKSPTPSDHPNNSPKVHPKTNSFGTQSELIRSSSVSSASGNSVKEEEEINLEYLRNVIIKFLESKSTRAQLIPVLTMMLKFTPEEIKRLNHAA
jgi:hypothetical protein